MTHAVLTQAVVDDDKTKHGADAAATAVEGLVDAASQKSAKTVLGKIFRGEGTPCEVDHEASGKKYKMWHASAGIPTTPKGLTLFYHIAGDVAHIVAGGLHRTSATYDLCFFRPIEGPYSAKTMALKKISTPGTVFGSGKVAAAEAAAKDRRAGKGITGKKKG